MASQAASTSPLFKLPPELRNVIYRLALTTDGEIDVRSEVLDMRALCVRIALLQVSSTLRKEATSIFYSENCFELLLVGPNIGISLKWLESLGSNICSLHSIVLLVGLDQKRYHGIEHPLWADFNFGRRINIPIWDEVELLLEQLADTDAEAILTKLEGLQTVGLAPTAVEIKAAPPDGVRPSGNAASLYTDRLIARLQPWTGQRSEGTR